MADPVERHRGEVLEAAVDLVAIREHDGDLDAVTMAEVRACAAGIEAAGGPVRTRRG